MARTTPMHALVLALVGCLWAACGGDGGPSAPRAPGGGGSPPGGRPPTSRADAAPPSSAGGDDDAGAGGVTPSDPNVVPGECVNLDPDLGADPPPGGFTTSVSTPTDLLVTRVETTWEGDCDDPALRITLSDGLCPNGGGHEVVLYIDALAVEDARVTRGQHVIEPEPANSGLRARYNRPKRTDPAAIVGEWGTCLGATGTVDLPLGVDLSRRGRVTGKLLLQLTPCDDTAEGTQDVVASFDVTLRRGLNDFCPAK